MRTMRDLSMLRVVDVVHRRGAASRSELARLTGLSRSTVAAVVSDLQSRGLMLESVEDRQAAGRGRPAGRLRLNPAMSAAVGVDFDHRHVRVAVADSNSTILAERTEPADVDTFADAALDLAAEMIEECLAEADIERSRVIAAGMGLPGPIDSRSVRVGQSVILASWAGREAGEELQRRIGIPVRFDNDANLGGLAEVSVGSGQGFNNVIYLKASSGIGAGLILDGRIYRGATGIAGEIGHVHVRSDGPVCRCGSRGCLETVANTSAILALLRSTYRQDLALGDVFDLVQSGDLGVCRVIGDAGLAIGRTLADLCNVLNPEAIIVGGELSAAGDVLLDGIRDAIQRYSQADAARAVQVVRGVLGDRAELLGALALVNSDADPVRAMINSASATA